MPPPVDPRRPIGLNVNNVLDEAYRPFPGAPTMGRMIIARVKYEF